MMTEDTLDVKNDVSLRKTLWSRILSRIKSWQSDIEKLFEPEGGVDSVAFSISFIALAAKLSKADGQVTRDEVTTFRKIFLIPEEDEKSAARVYNLCRETVTGYEAYARKMNDTLGPGEEADAIRLDVLDGLMHIAMADGEFHPNEEAFLDDVSSIFGISKADYIAAIARHVPDRSNPFDILGLPHDANEDDIKSARKRLARENHPDILAARGVPEEMVALGEARMIAVNLAFEEAQVLLANKRDDTSFDI